MKLYFDKENCEFREDVNGRVLIVETTNPVYIEELSAKMLLHSQWDNDFGSTDKPFLTEAPKEYKI